MTHQTNSITQTKKIIMKNRLRYSLLLLLSMVFSLASQAQTLIDGIYYSLDTETSTASVTKGKVKYSGEIIIPSSVEWNGTEYSVTSIGYRAFFDCTSLTSIEIPSSVTSIGEGAFSYCSSLTSIEIPSSVTSIGSKAFGDCSSLTSIDIPSSVTSIGDYAFDGCASLTSIVIPSSVTSIGYVAFSSSSSLTSITVDPDNATYDSRDNCNAIIQTSDNTLILGCQSTIIPGSVTSIGDWAFHACTSLTSVEIPSSVTSIGDRAFSYCTSLTSVVCKAVTPPTCDSDVFGGVPTESAKLYVPEASIGAYRTTSPWSTFGSILPLSDFDTKIDAVEETADRGASAHAVYSLSGQRTVLPGSGIYITNGKVFIAK